MADRRCSSCGLNNHDWLDRCGRCGSKLPRLAPKEEPPATRSTQANSQAQSVAELRRKQRNRLSAFIIVTSLILFVAGVVCSLILFARFLYTVNPAASQSDIVWVMVVCDLALFFAVWGLGVWFKNAKNVHPILHVLLLLAIAYVFVAGFFLAICAIGLGYDQPDEIRIRP